MASFLDLETEHRAQVLDLAIPHLDPASLAYLALTVVPSEFLVITPANVKAVFTRISRNGMGPDVPGWVVLGGWGAIAADFMDFMGKGESRFPVPRFALVDEWDTKGQHRGPIALARVCIDVWRAAVARRPTKGMYFTDAVPTVRRLNGFTSNHSALAHLFTRSLPRSSSIPFIAPRVCKTKHVCHLC